MDVEGEGSNKAARGQGSATPPVDKDAGTIDWPSLFSPQHDKAPPADRAHVW